METENIKEGLKLAISKGESLEKAMQSFYNAGYKKEEIEEAARSLKNPSGNLNVLIQNAKSPAKIPSQIQDQTQQQIQNKNQVVSSYGEKKEHPRRTLIIASLLIIFFLAAIVFVLFYSEEVITFINNLIGQNA